MRRRSGATSNPLVWVAFVVTFASSSSMAFSPSAMQLQPDTVPVSSCQSRGDFLSRMGKAMAIIIPSSNLLLGADEAEAVASSSADDEIQLLRDGSDALGSLLTNWDRATVDCTYADVPRELLETKNKELLLEKAKTSALFDKSASVVSCRKNVRIVRDYIGSTGKGPLINADKRFLKRVVADRVDPDMLDDYYSNVEAFSQAIARAATLSYTAGMSDMDSINTFAKGDEAALGDSASLEQARKAIVEAKDAMDKAIEILMSTADS
mmetsp:Transcript_14046/g.30508  ORF Transcript_14046/g.30508 Transcript_14046/m.30508 type:complete len:266 (+) Transcript_14046:388-1185(+)